MLRELGPPERPEAKPSARDFTELPDSSLLMKEPNRSLPVRVDLRLTISQALSDIEAAKNGMSRTGSLSLPLRGCLQAA